MNHSPISAIWDMGLNHSKQSDTVLLGIDDDPLKYINPSPLPPNPHEVDDHCNIHKCCLTVQTLNLPSDDCKGHPKLPRTREYIVHEPQDLMKRRIEDKTTDADLLPLVLCLHGTDETIKDTELLAQEDRQTLWLELSHAQNFIVVFPQSLRYRAKENIPISWRPLGDDIRTCWQPDHNDELFISSLLDHLIESYHIDTSKVYCVGYSNGGLFLTSLLLFHGLDKRFTAVCNYMGGMSPDQLKDIGLNGADIAYHCDQPCVGLLGIGSTLHPVSDTEQTQTNSKSLGIKPNDEYTESSTDNLDNSVTQQTLVANETYQNVFKNPLQWQSRFNMTSLPQSVQTPPIYIITSSRDTNRNYCYNALCGFKQLQYEVYFDDLKEVEHEYQSMLTYDIWKFFTLYVRGSTTSEN